MQLFFFFKSLLIFMNSKHAEFQNCVGQHEQKSQAFRRRGKGNLDILRITPAESGEVRLNECSG